MWILDSTGFVKWDFMFFTRIFISVKSRKFAQWPGGTLQGVFCKCYTELVPPPSLTLTHVDLARIPPRGWRGPSAGDSGFCCYGNPPANDFSLSLLWINLHWKVQKQLSVKRTIREWSSGSYSNSIQFRYYSQLSVIVYWSFLLLSHSETLLPSKNIKFIQFMKKQVLLKRLWYQLWLRNR